MQRLPGVLMKPGQPWRLLIQELPALRLLAALREYDGVYAEWSPNEKVAMEVGAGASIGGARTLVAMKHVGSQCCGWSSFYLCLYRVNGGLVIVSGDDPGMHSSQNEQDNRGYGRFAKLPVIEPSDSQEALDFTRLAFDLEWGIWYPGHAADYHPPGSFADPGRRREKDRNVPLKDYKKNAAKYVMLPGHARMRHVEVEKRMLDSRNMRRPVL